MTADFLPLLIGSLPHTDVQTAVETGFRFCPNSPSWPQLPKLSPFEGMNLQYLEGIPGWQIKDGKVVFRKSSEITGEISAAIERTFAGDSDSFRITPANSRTFNSFIQKLSTRTRPVFVKGQVVGPVTFLTSHITDEGRRLLQDDGYRELIPRCLNMKAKFQIGQFKKAQPDSDCIIFFDEPILAEIGSAVSNLNHDDIHELLLTASEGLDARIGVHICGNSDWDFMLRQPIDIINFDAYAYGEQFLVYPDAIREFLEKGGCIALGIVPTDAEALRAETFETLVLRTDKIIKSLRGICGKDDIVNARLFLTPSCGMGTLTEQESEKALKILASLTAHYRK